ncbi:hypothetical protein BD770DRAFT_155806 [Pilaira anomala]|nr:hypothetical protein BD770DRAFT_155806 [Pilaira anomala]
MPRKILHRISRIFNPKESITAIEPDPDVITTAHITPITLQRAPSSKLLIDDYMDISIDYYYHEPKEQIKPIVIVESYKRSDPHRQSWMANLSKLKSLKKSSSNKKLKRSNDCWFNQRQVGEMIEIPDHHHEQQQQQQGVSESPLSLASSLCSNQINPLSSSSSSSSWLPIEEEDNISTARTSLDSRLIKIIDFSSIQEQPRPIAAAAAAAAAKQQQKQISASSKMNLAENVKQILGDAIFLADQELDI